MKRGHSVLGVCLLIIILVSVFALSGCGGQAQTAGDDEPKLPASFPGDFPVYPKTKLVSSDWVLNGAGETELRLKWEGPGRVAEVLGYFEKTLPKQGWNYSMARNLQTKTLNFDRIESTEHKGRLIIGPVDPSEEKEGVFIGVVMEI